LELVFCSSLPCADSGDGRCLVSFFREEIISWLTSSQTVCSSGHNETSSKTI
jgi:hypothetical protein